MRILTFVLTGLSFAVPAAYAQDPVKVDPKHYQVEFENEHVRVLRITYAPGEKSVMHEHPGAVAVFFTDGETRMTLPSGETEPSPPMKKNTAVWTPAATHLPENVGETPIELILVEVKATRGGN